MNKFVIKPYNSALSLVKALDFSDNEVCGFYFTLASEPLVFKSPNESIIKKINPFTICRNSGIKDSKGVYIYEYDLLKLKRSGFADCYGYLVWEEFYKAWKIRKFTEYGGTSDVGNYTVEVVGNVVLNDDNAEIIYKQDEEELKREGYIDTSDCRPSHKIKQKRW